MGSSVRMKLSVMMFLQYATWGAWAVSIGGYMGTTLNFSGVQIGSIYSTTALAAMISPLFMGFVADRFLATEKMIALLHLIGAVLLTMAALTTDFDRLYVVMLAYAICYMPTLALTNSISFANIGDPQKDFPRIRVWGTWGWIVVGLVVGFWLDKPKGTSNAPIFLAAACSAVLGLYSFQLPHTPPKGKLTRAESAGGASVIELLSDPTFLVFVLCSFLICIPLAFYYNFANVFLTETDAPYPTALQTIGQLSEVGFMSAMPILILRLGVKRMLAIGMLAWVVRYFCFGSLFLPLVVFGLVLHGVCFDFFFVASQIYVDNRADERQRASAQSFIAFVTLGVGMFVGAYIGGLIVDAYPPEIQVDVKIVSGKDDGNTTQAQAPLPLWAIDENPVKRKGLAKQFNLEPDGAVTADLIVDDLIEVDDKTGDKTIYRRDSLIAAVQRADSDGDGKVTYSEWRAAQAHRWHRIWLWPALAAAGTLALFWLGFRGPRDPQLVRGMANEAPLGSGEGLGPQVG